MKKFLPLLALGVSMQLNAEMQELNWSLDTFDSIDYTLRVDAEHTGRYVRLVGSLQDTKFGITYPVIGSCTIGAGTGIQPAAPTEWIVCEMQVGTASLQLKLSTDLEGTFIYRNVDPFGNNRIGVVTVL